MEKKKRSLDIGEVDQFGFINLADAYSKGSISGDVAVSSSESFNTASPDSMMHRPLDIFDAQRQRMYVRDSLAAKASAEQVTE